MKCHFIHLKLKDKSHDNLELLKLSVGNNKNSLYYNKKKSSNQNLGIIYYKNYYKKNIGKMIYKTTENSKEINILNKVFISKNIKRAKIIIENKQYKLKENIKSKKQIYKVKIKFLDNIILLNYMFRDCKLLSSIHNFQNLNTKYLKRIFDLFYGCSSLLFIDDISNWNTNKLNNIRNLFYQCSSLESIPNISKWNLNNIKDIIFLFY